MKVLLCMLVALFAGSGGMAQASNTTVTEGEIAAPLADVWSAWTTSAGLKSWMAPHADFDLRVGGLMRANYDPKGSLGDGGTIENRILSFEPQRMLSIRVSKAPDNFPFAARVPEMWTVLYFDPVSADRTRLRIVGLGFTEDAESQKMKGFFQKGNDYTLSMLQKRFAK